MHVHMDKRTNVYVVKCQPYYRMYLHLNLIKGKTLGILLFSPFQLGHWNGALPNILA